MPLRLTLKPNEKVIIGGAVIQNGATVAHLTIANKVPILRQGDIMTEAEATSPCKRIYLAVQLMYIDETASSQLHPVYWELVKDVVTAAPSMKNLLSDLSQHILDGRLYQALKLAKKLISYEEELIRHATESG